MKCLTYRHMKPLLSIIIPTKNRYAYLTDVLHILVTMKYDNLEYIITDNTPDNEEFSKFIEKLNDSRIKYFHRKDNMSQSENSDYALSKANGAYVCFIGDDDVILENIFVMVKKMEEDRIDCMIQDPVTYYWPDVDFKYASGSQKPASFNYGDYYKYEFTQIDVAQELEGVLDCGATKIGLLPRVYHGIVKKEILDKIKEKCGTYFPGPSPDMASSVALSLLSAKTVLSNMAFTISGKSGKSASGMGLKHTHKGDLNKDFLPGNILETWNHKIPQFWSCSTIWAQSASTSLNAFHSTDRINYKALYTNLLVFEPSYTEQINDKIKEIFEEHKLLNYSILYMNYTAIFFKRIISFLKRRFVSENGNVTHTNINSIFECYSKVSDLVNQNKLT
jgi:glycosyltransferase involved in cell wall biosynthesis